MGGHSYAYDGLSNRISQTVSSVVTEYLLDVQPGLTKVVGATTSGNTERYVHAQRGIHAMEDSSGVWTHPAQDGLGSVRMELSDSLTVNGMQILSPFGVVESSKGAIGIPFGFTGEMADGDLVYLRNRYLNTDLGVFPSLDPFEGLHDRPMSLNGYSWVEGRVPNATDPTGMMFWGPRGLGRFTMYFGQFVNQTLNTSFVHTRTQIAAMVGSPEIIHAEYPIPIGFFNSSDNLSDALISALEILTAQETNYVDVLNEVTGEMWEIKPKSQATAAASINRAQIELMESLKQLNMLTGTDHPITGGYDWNLIPSVWSPGVGIFDGFPIYLGTSFDGWVRFYAKQDAPGTILWYTVENRIREPQPVDVPVLVPPEMVWSPRNRESTHPGTIHDRQRGLIPNPQYVREQAYYPICTANCHYPEYTPAPLLSPEASRAHANVMLLLPFLCVTWYFAPYLSLPASGSVWQEAFVR